MHWTDVLSRKYLAPGTMVIDDLSCMGCGYNLRGVPAAGRCPECGARVGDSLCVLRRPRRVAASARSLAWSFGGLASALLIPAEGWTGFPGLTWVGLGLLLCFSVFRAIAAFELRHRCALENLPSIGTRLQALWWIALVELGTVATATVTRYLAGMTSNPFSPVAEEIFVGAVLVWIVAVVAMALIIGSLGSALAAVLGYAFVEREFRIQRTLVVIGAAAGALCVFLGVVLGAAGSSPTVVRVLMIVALGLFLLAWAVAHGYTIVGMLHVAAAAERDLDIREEVIGEGAGPGAATPAAPPADLGPISLDE